MFSGLLPVLDYTKIDEHVRSEMQQEKYIYEAVVFR
jgi:hypothetical protein